MGACTHEPMEDTEDISDHSLYSTMLHNWRLQVSEWWHANVVCIHLPLNGHCMKALDISRRHAHLGSSGVWIGCVQNSVYK